MITIDRNININEARAAGPYYVSHEDEAGGGFYDIALVLVFKGGDCLMAEEV